MATPLQETVEFAQFVEKELSAKCAERDPDFASISALIAQYRTASEAIIFNNYSYAVANGIEVRFWAAHSKVNNRYRAQLSKIRKGGAATAVHARKFAHAYLDFIKSSQRCYRGFIVKLNDRIGGIPELKQVAQQMEPKDRLSAHAEGLRGHRSIEQKEPNGSANQVLPEVKHQALISCHQTLIRLGDLSRYRVTERLDKDRNWGPAVGYYGLAGTLRPSSGQSYNQQAVVALAEGNHLNATYNLYRAIAVEEPDPNAPGNLEIEFKKIVSAWSKGELIRRDSNAPAKALVAWFIRLHSKCYKGQAFSEHDELENEVMSQLAVELKERPLDGTLHKFVLINAAAQYIASQRWHNNTESSEALQAYLFFFRLNIKTFLTLLRLLQADLERISPEERDSKQGERAQMLSDKIAATTRRILPPLRLYSCWSLVNARIRSVALVGDATLEHPMRELWKAYAAALSLLAAAFPIELLPTADYLLEEDADTIGFKPLISDRTMKNWYKEGVSGVLKPKYFDQGTERQHPNVEMLMRIRGLLWDGLLLAVDESIPLTVQDFRFIYESSSTASERTANLADNSLLAPVVSVQPSDVLQSSKNSKIVDTRTLHDLDPSDAPASLSVQMSRMVDDLVGSDADVLDVLPEDEEDLPPTPPEQTFDDTAVVASNGETSYSVGSLTAHELVHMASKFSQNKVLSGRRTSPPARLNSSGTPSAVRYSRGNGISNGTPSPPAQRLTPLPGMPSIWNTDISTERPSSPYFPPGLAVGTRSSPLPPPSRGHSRGGSINSVASMQMNDGDWPSKDVISLSSLDVPPLPSLDRWGSSSLWVGTPAAPPGLENGQAGRGVAPGALNSRSGSLLGYPDAPSIRAHDVIHQRELAFGYGQTNNVEHDTGMLSPMLFGAGAGPWSTNSTRGSGRSRSSMNTTPPNGQARASSTMA
ncbi:hypothetical protein LTR04_006316, partial [Oleoguttula sp. CCFEE 6159]